MLAQGDDVGSSGSSFRFYVLPRQKLEGAKKQRPCRGAVGGGSGGGSY